LSEVRRTSRVSASSPRPDRAAWSQLPGAFQHPQPRRRSAQPLGPLDRPPVANGPGLIPQCERPCPPGAESPASPPHGRYGNEAVTGGAKDNEEFTGGPIPHRLPQGSHGDPTSPSSIPDSAHKRHAGRAEGPTAMCPAALSTARCGLPSRPPGDRRQHTRRQADLHHHGVSLPGHPRGARSSRNRCELLKHGSRRRVVHDHVVAGHRLRRPAVGRSTAWHRRHQIPGFLLRIEQLRAAR
jgi:hypothetical protein